jgi:hypothetical protein
MMRTRDQRTLHQRVCDFSICPARAYVFSDAIYAQHQEALQFKIYAPRASTKRDVEQTALCYF